MTAADETDTPARSSRARPLDPRIVDDILARAPSLPEPLAALVLEIELAQDEGDATGVRKRLYELAIGVVRYGLSFGLAALVSCSAGGAAPGPLADALRKSFKLTDGRWFELVRMLESALRKPMPAAARCLKFGASAAGNALVASRNAFIHGGGAGDDAPDRTLAVLDAASELLALPLRVVTAATPASLEIRHGVPKRRDVWKKEEMPSALAGAAAPEQALVKVADAFVRIDPWLPLVERALRLVDSPHAPGRGWRCIFPETGEHREHPELDCALQSFVGDDGRAPRPPTDKPALVRRATELALVERALREAAAGRVRVVVVSGPQGAGLSRIADETVGAAGVFGFATVVHAFGSADRRTPFAALRMALPETEEMLPLRAAIERLTSDAHLSDRARVDAEIEAIEERIVEASRRASMLVVVDDAQWLDEQSVALLRLLVDRANRGAAGSLAVLAVVRRDPSSSPGLAQFLLQVDRDVGSGATRVPIEPLDGGNAKLLAERVAAIAPDVAEQVVRGASGLPFYIVQPLLVWVESGALEWKDGAWIRRASESTGDPTANGVPGLAELVEARVSSFFDAGSDAERVASYTLACLAADGAPTPPRRLAHVLERMQADTALAARVLDTLRDAAIVIEREPAGYAIPQPIVAQALFTQYRKRSWWRELFGAVLASLAEEPEKERDAEKLARGYEVLGAKGQASTWYRAAVVQRLRQGSFDAARALAESVAAGETTDADRLRAELWAVEALRRNGALREARERHRAIYVPAEPKQALAWAIAGEELAVAMGEPAGEDLDALVARADASGDAQEQVEVRIILARRRRGAAGRALVRDALSVLDGTATASTSDARYRLLALDVELAYELRDGGVDELRATAARAKSAARQIGSTWAELDAENDVAILESDLGDTAAAITRLLDVAQRAGAAHFGSLRRLALTNAAALLLRAQRVDDARAQALLAEDEARAAGDVRMLAVALSVRSETELLRDDAQAALRAISECIELRERGGEKNLTVALLRRADARARLGEAAAARADGDLALARAREAENVDHAALAELWLAMHDAQDAHAAGMIALRAVIASLTAIESKLRAPTRRKLEEARALVARVHP